MVESRWCTGVAVDHRRVKIGNVREFVLRLLATECFN